MVYAQQSKNSKTAADGNGISLPHRHNELLLFQHLKGLMLHLLGSTNCCHRLSQLSTNSIRPRSG